MSTEVIMPDGSKTDLLEHLRLVHLKGTRGFTEEYLASLHDNLHQRKRDPLPEHDHPGTEMAMTEFPTVEIPRQRGPVEDLAARASGIVAYVRTWVIGVASPP